LVWKVCIISISIMSAVNCTEMIPVSVLFTTLPYTSPAWMRELPCPDISLTIVQYDPASRAMARHDGPPPSIRRDRGVEVWVYLNMEEAQLRGYETVRRHNAVMPGRRHGRLHGGGEIPFVSMAVSASSPYKSCLAVQDIAVVPPCAFTAASVCSPPSSNLALKF
jgi:hypothetical protein